MPRPVTGRRPDSLFDNRYRYDYIYPRGRSGETLRAYDTLAGNAPVVIKRPALQDAPPIRAGQEVTILNEKRALELLSGHPVLTELRHSGTFRVGGQVHHYIVMDMARGRTVEEMVLELDARGEHLPELEMLNILEGLLDLLQAAHDRNMVYNDVDAKHLFWDRESYTLKMIDWGNVVFLDSEHAPQHITRATDILQTGQLLYFILSGGHRFESGQIDPADALGEAISPRMKSIINRAVHPELPRRYPDLAALRQELAEVRRPIQKNRDMLVERARSRLQSASNQRQFEELKALLHEALAVDPGYPPARELLAEIETRLKQIALQGDLDAIRIYIESGNLDRASDLIDEMMAQFRDTELPLLLYLRDVCAVLEAQPQASEEPLLIAEGLSPALEALFRDDPQGAARALMTTQDPRSAGQLQQFLLAERLTRRVPGVVLLRPHLVRLEEELARLPESGKALLVIRSLSSKLEAPVSPGIQPLRRVYQYIADMLVGLEADLKRLVVQNGQAARAGETPLDVANRARQAADSLVELLEVVAQNVLGDSSRAGNALWHASAIDPAHPAFEALNDLLNNFHADLNALRAFSPAPDGANIADFLAQARARLAPYTADVTDAHFQQILRGIDGAMANWGRLVDAIALGGRRPAAEACHLAAEGIRPLNKAAAYWFEEYLRRIESTARVELLSPNAVLGRGLADGWEAWDRGRTADSMLAGKRAADVAVTEAEKLAARRLIGLSEALDRWLEREGQGAAQTEATERRILTLLLPEEEGTRQKFASQMPSLPIYLKAMAKGVVEPLRDASAAAARVLFFDYVLRGMLALQKEQFDEAEIWKEAAAKTLDHARLHPAYQTLDNAIARRQLILEAVRVLNETRSVENLNDLRQAVRAPLAAAQLEQADQAVRALEDALRRWPDGDFRAARLLLDTAIDRANAAQGVIGKDLSPFKAWLQDLADSAEILAQARRVIEQAALVPADAPDPAVAEAHEKLVHVTRRDLGEPYTAQLRQWRDTYVGILEIYTDDALDKADKLRLLEGHFASLFIDRQPARPIFRHWQEIIRRQPDPEPEPPPAPDIPAFLVGRVGETAASRSAAGSAGLPAGETDDEGGAARFDADGTEPAGPRGPARARKPRQRSVSALSLLGGGILIAVVAAVVLIVGGHGPADSPAQTPTGERAAGALSLSPTPRLTDTPEPTPTTPPPTPTPVPPTATPIPPTATPEQPVPTPTHHTPVPTGELLSAATLAVFVTPTATSEPTLSAGVAPGTPVPTSADVVLPTIPPEARSGVYDVLEALGGLEAQRISWDTDWFGPRDDAWELGNPQTRTGRAPLIRLGPDVLTPLFGADAAQYLRRMDVTLELVSYEPSLLPTGQVFFGAGFESLQGQRAAVEARLIQANVLDLGINLNARFLKKTQLPVAEVKLDISIERNEDRTLSLFVDGQLLGPSNAAYPPDLPVSIYLYTSTGGVIVRVTSLTVHLDQNR